MHTHTHKQFSSLGVFSYECGCCGFCCCFFIIIIMNIPRLRAVYTAVCLFPYASNYLEALYEQFLRALRYFAPLSTCMYVRVGTSLYYIHTHVYTQLKKSNRCVMYIYLYSEYNLFEERKRRGIVY